MKTQKIKSLLTIVGIVSIVGVSFAFTNRSAKVYQPVKEQQTQWKNLKVLPQNISKDSLFTMMKGFTVSLGVNCTFCHAASKEDPKKLDFPSDAKHTKLIARGMIQMMNDINSKYFQPHSKNPKVAVTDVTCVTCHRGNSNPKEYLNNVAKMMVVMHNLKPGEPEHEGGPQK